MYILYLYFETFTLMPMVAMETAVLEEKHHNNKRCAELEEVVSRLQVDIDKIGTIIL